MIKHRHTMLSGAIALVIAAPAWAQDPANSAPNTADIIVTANKRGENVQDIAGGITAVSGESLRDMGLANVKDLATAIPNLNFAEIDGATLVTIRGVGSTVESGVTEPTVAMYVDGVFLPRQTMSVLRAVDLERVEVLRGPQGTLYGRNATGGAINFISKAPTTTFTGGLTLSGGGRNAYGVSGFISGPLADGVLFRLSGGHEKQDGFVKVLNTGARLGGTDVAYVRGALRLQPSSDLTVDLSVRYEHNVAPNSYHMLLTPSPLAPPALQTTRKNHLINDAPSGGDVSTFIAAGTINWDISDAISLRSITSYVDHKSKVGFDADGTGVDFYNVVPGSGGSSRPSESYAQELNLIGQSDRLKWILGAYYFHEKASNSLPVRLGTVGGPALGGLPAGTRLDQMVFIKQHSIAFYGDLTYSLTDALRINLGLRYNDEKQKFVQVFGITGVPGLDPAVRVPLDQSRSKVLPKVNVQYDFTPNIMGYAQWSRGYKSGGVNLPGGGGENLGSAVGFYQPENIDAYELGLKTQAFDHALTLNASAFYYAYKDLQLSLTIPPAATRVNNADARVYGLELESTIRPTAALTLTAAATFTHARFKDFGGFDSGTRTFINLDDKPLPHAPDFTTNLGAAYRFDLGGNLLSSLTVRANFLYSSSVVLRYFGTPNDSSRAFENLNLSASLANVGENIELRGFVNNVTNDIHRTNISHYGTAAYYTVYNAPRTWGAELSFKF